MVSGKIFATVRPHVLNATTWLYSRLRLRHFPQSGLRVLMYHAIGTPVVGDIRGIYNMQFERFEEHMRYLAKNYREQLVPLDDAALKGSSLKIAITFDDGYKDNLSVAAPLLDELGVPFTIFVCTGAVSQQTSGFLNETDLRELDGMCGATIASHSVSHPRLSDCDDLQLKEELEVSKVYLENLLGHKVETLSYPNGAVDQRVRDMAESVGYRIGATSRLDINRPGRDPLLLCRINIDAQDDIAILEQKLRGDWDWGRWRSIDPAN